MAGGRNVRTSVRQRVMRGASLGVDEDVGQVVGHGLGVVAFDVDDHGVALLDAQTHDGQDGAGRNGVAAFLGRWSRSGRKR